MRLEGGVLFSPYFFLDPYKILPHLLPSYQPTDYYCSIPCALFNSLHLWRIFVAPVWSKTLLFRFVL